MVENETTEFSLELGYLLGQNAVAGAPFMLIIP